MKGKLRGQKFVDRNVGKVLGLGVRFSRKFKKRPFPESVQKIVIYKLNAIGDSILCLPMIRELKKKTKAKVVVVCVNENKDVFFNQKFIDEIIIFDPKKISSVKKIQKIKADVAIDTGQSAYLSSLLANYSSKFSIGFENSSKSRSKIYDESVPLNPAKHMVLNYFSLAKRFNPELNLNLEKLHYLNKDSEKISGFLRNGRNFVGIHACNLLKYKVWPRERFARVLDYLIGKGYSPVLVGSPGESLLNKKLIKELGEPSQKKVIDLSGEISIRELISLMPQLKFFIALDGGPMHIAAAMGIPTIGIFGHETPKRYAPFNEKSLSVYKNHHCAPCNKAYEYSWPTCENPNCLNNISVEEVLNAIKRIQ